MRIETPDKVNNAEVQIINTIGEIFGKYKSFNNEGIYDISANIFSGSPYAYFGFTAAVGSYTNDQRIRILNTVFVSEGVSGTVKNTSCSSLADGAINIVADRKSVV